PLDRRQALLGLAAVAGMPTLAWGQAPYPSRPIRFVVPFAAATGADIACRNLTQPLAVVLGQPVIVENRGGGAGSIGSVEIAKAAPDGYTIGYGNVGTLSINRALLSSLPYNPDGFTPIAMLGRVQNVLVVRNDMPVKTVQDLIAYARKNPGKLNMASGGNGTTGHLGGELFKAMAGVFMVHVPYRGAGQALADLMGGSADLMFDNIASALPHIKSGRIRALGVSGAQRSPVLPDVPTIQEAGLKDYETTAWGGVVGPPGMPAELVQRLNRDINRTLEQPAVKERYAAMAFETLTGPPEALMALARAEAPRWADVVRRSGAKME
ncbi:MAG: tripartite tricarboxylate transporter substrate binding protein, partial [Burkholderiales bacterium]